MIADVAKIVGVAMQKTGVAPKFSRTLPASISFKVGNYVIDVGRVICDLILS